MNWNLLLLGSLRNLRRFKLRSFFMSIGVAVGVATLIAGASAGSGAAKQITAQIDQIFGPGTIVIASRELKVADLQAVADEMEQVVAWAPRQSIGEQEIAYLGENRLAAVTGYSENSDYVWNRGVTDGRFFSDDDVQRASRVALIGTSLKQEIFGDGEALGEEIMIRAVPFEVIGVLEAMGIDPHGDDRDMDIYVPITTSMRRLANTDIVGTGKLVVSNADQVESDSDQVANILRERYQVAEGQPEPFAIYTSKFAGKAAIKAKELLGVYVMIAAAVVLLVAAVVISSIMLIVVRERIAEIGLRKALGATPQLIAVQFLFESTILTVLSGVIGVGLGIAVASAISAQNNIPMQLTPLSVSLAVVASVLVGIVAGIIPARRAARLDPVEALR